MVFVGGRSHITFNSPLSLSLTIKTKHTHYTHTRIPNPPNPSAKSTHIHIFIIYAPICILPIYIDIIYDYIYIHRLSIRTVSLIGSIIQRALDPHTYTIKYIYTYNLHTYRSSGFHLYSSDLLSLALHCVFNQVPFVDFTLGLRQ